MYNEASSVTAPVDEAYTYSMRKASQMQYAADTQPIEEAIQALYCAK